MSVFITIIHIVYIFISCNVSHHIIASVAHVYYSLMFNNVILHMLMFIIHLFIVLSVDVVLLLITVTLKVLSHIPYLALFHFSLSNYEQLCIHVDGWLSC